MRNVRNVLGLFSAALLLSAASDYKVQTRYPVPGTGGWDYVTLDSATRRLYISHATQVDVLDADSGKFVGTIPDTPGVHGIAIASAFKHGFTSNGRENKVSMFDPATSSSSRRSMSARGRTASTTIQGPSAFSPIITVRTISAPSMPKPARWWAR